jgi:tetratricopeptide (TPR) repeat protein
MARLVVIALVGASLLALAQGKTAPKAAPAKGAAAKKGAADAGVKDAGQERGPGNMSLSPSGTSATPVADLNPDGGAKVEVKPEEKAKTRYFEGMGHSPAEVKQLEELTQALQEYESESKEFKREVQLLVEKKYEEKRNSLANSYEKAIRDLEVLERRERLDAIAQFEEFLARYPDDPKYTPDVMFRLAELYYEKSSDDQNLAMRDYEEQIKKLDPLKNVTPPPEPKVDFSKSIALYDKLIKVFPDYRLNDAAYYLLGYCLEKQESFESSRAAYTTLIAKYPKSKFTTEAWVRIGEYYFDAYDVKDALTLSADAYEHAIIDTKHALYDKALYKLGWVYYRMDRFDDSVARFITLIDYYQAKAKEKGEEEVGGDLRNEALQYTAVSFVDEKWGSLAKAQDMFAKLGGRPYEAEIYRRMADIYFDQTKHPEAIEAYRLVLAKNPLIKDAPQIQQKIVQAYERDRKLDEAFAESSRLANMFSPGTPWHEKWKRDPDVVQAAGDMAEKSLYSTAIYHHQQALVFKQEGKFEQAKATFESAAKAYDTYLKRFPRSKNAYEMEFYLADCLYNSLQFGEAAKHYVAVRDSSQDNRYLTESAFSAVLSLQKQYELDVLKGVAPKLPVKLSKDWGDDKPAIIPMVESEKALIAASDSYVGKVKADEKSPGIAYKAAELFYVHNDFVEARKRFDAIITNYPQSEVAQYAVNLTVESWLIDKNYPEVEKAIEKFTALKNGKGIVDPKSPLYKDLIRFQLGAKFKYAEEQMAKGNYDDAAKKYLELVDADPKHEFADKALNNAAVCYENVHRFDSALRLYERIVRDYPKSKLADAALFRVAVNAENSYDFDKAVDSYTKLIKDYPTSKDRESALFNTARLLEALQRFNEAATAYLRYADLYPKSEDAPKNQFRAALIYEKQGDYPKEIGALNEFIQKFSKDKTQAELVVDSKKRIAECYVKLNKDADAKKAWAAAADEFDKRGLKPEDNPIAADAAGVARFQLAEYDLKEFDKIKISGTGKALEKSFTSKKTGVKGVQDAYSKVIPYKRIEWTLAAFYRKGYVLERFAQTITETPVPPEVKRLGDEAVAAYQDQLATMTVALEDKAVENYIATLAEARKQHISNEWTKRTLESLNRFRPKEYPVLKEPKQLLNADGVYQDGVVTNVEGPIRTIDAPQKLKGDDK